MSTPVAKSQIYMTELMKSKLIDVICLDIIKYVDLLEGTLQHKHIHTNAINCIIQLQDGRLASCGKTIIIWTLDGRQILFSPLEKRGFFSGGTRL